MATSAIESKLSLLIYLSYKVESSQASLKSGDTDPHSNGSGCSPDSTAGLHLSFLWFVFERGTENHVVEQQQASLLLHHFALGEHLEGEGVENGEGGEGSEGEKGKQTIGKAATDLASFQGHSH